MTKRLFAAALLLWAAAALAQAPQKVATVEGVTEYRLSNGLRVLTVPDPGIDTITVHITYLVGSRHEGYGEKGMAHLLEHLLFKGSERHPNIKDEFTRRGARYNGTTSNDRTNYFETFSASDANLEWAIELEADRMVNSRVSKADLDSEMTVVRNEFEMGQNNPGSVLFERMQQLAFPWHNYGNPVIGQRADIERVPIDRLQAFYRTWYQPDNAMLIVAGRFDEARALEFVGKHFGAIPKPARVKPVFYTEEPTQDGERNVTLRRVGENQILSTLYRIPAGSHPDLAAIDVLAQVLGDTPSGRLHRKLVEAGLATSVWGYARDLHDPGYASFGAMLPRSGDVDKARAALLGVLEHVAAEKITPAEVQRARTSLASDFEKTQLDTAQMVRVLSEYQAIGDWRLFFVARERLKAVRLEDVQRVAERYFKPANRVLGVFVPTDRPERAEIPPTPDLAATLGEYKGGEGVRLGEAFDPSPQNIQKRLLVRPLPNGIKAGLLPKQTRGGRAVASLTLHWGDEKTLTGREVACQFAGSMLMRGTKQRTRAEMKDALDRLNASVSVGGDGATIAVRRENLVPALRLVAEALREPSFPKEEFEQMKRAAMSSAESQKSDPSAVAGVHLQRHLQVYPVGHPNYTPTIDERIGWIRKTTLEDAQRCYRELFGATGADFAAVGDFDPDEVARVVGELFGSWKTPHPFKRVPNRHFDRPALERDFATPDKANAVLRGGLDIRMRDDHPDFPALLLANYLLGGTSTARVPGRVREKEGLSYSTYTSFSTSSFDEYGVFRISAIFAPQNRARVKQAIQEEITRALRDGFTAEEVQDGKKAILEQRRLQRTQDGALRNRIASYLYIGRTFAWDIELESKIMALTPEQTSAALRKYIDPAKLAEIFAGDFKKN